MLSCYQKNFISKPKISSKIKIYRTLFRPSLDHFGEVAASKFGNNLATAVGLGAGDWAPPGVSWPDTQQKLTMSVMDNKDCLANVEDLTSLHLCASREVGKVGDGSLLARRNKLSPWQVVGVVSGGTSVCGVGAPGIFTRVTQYRQWITDNLN